MTDTTAVLGYAWPLVVSPGEEVAFHLSSATLETAEATLLRVRCADPDPDGPGLRFHQRGSPIDGPVALRHQPLRPGSCAIVPDAPVLNRGGSLSLGRQRGWTLSREEPYQALRPERSDISCASCLYAL